MDEVRRKPVPYIAYSPSLDANSPVSVQSPHSDSDRSPLSSPSETSFLCRPQRVQTLNFQQREHGAGQRLESTLSITSLQSSSTLVSSRQHSFSTPDSSEKVEEKSYKRNTVVHIESKDDELKPPSPQRIQRSIFRSWWLELLGLLISLGSMTSAVAVLRAQSGKPLTSWKFLMSLNTLISILGVICRATLAFAISACIGQQKWNWFRMRKEQVVAFDMFDQASRGPWGSARLLWFLNVRHWAALGPFAVIIFLAFDPFFQATISYDGSLVQVENDTWNITIGSVEQLDLGVAQARSANSSEDKFWDSSGDTSIPLYKWSAHPDFGVASAVYAGFYNSSIPTGRTVQHSCHTGNCTWPRLASLAICSACNDVSSQIKKVKGLAGRPVTGARMTRDQALGKENVGWAEASRLGTDVPLEDWMLVPFTDYTKYEVGYGHIKTFDGYKLADIPAAVVDERLGEESRSLMTVFSQAQRRNSISFQDTELLLSSFLMIKASQSYMMNQTAWQDSTPTATECALSLCVKAFETELRNGVIHETESIVPSRFDPYSWVPFVASGNSVPGGGPYCWGTPTCAVLDRKEDDRSLYGDSLRPKRSPLTLNIEQNGTVRMPQGSGITGRHGFVVRQKTIESTIQFLLSLTASVTGTMVFPVVDGPTERSGVPTIIFPLMESSNLTETFENVARSITNHLRNTASVPYAGTMKEWVIYTTVKWTYLILPVLSTLTGVVYVLLTMMETRRLGLPAWKEDALKTLAYGLDEKTSMALRTAEMQGREEEARRTAVGLGVESDGMRLKAG